MKRSATGFVIPIPIILMFVAVTSQTQADVNAGSGPVTFSKHIAPIFQQKCEECHRPGQIAPMSLRTYKESRPWAKSIKKQVIGREMPPWDADPRFGNFKNDISLNEDQIALISKWVDQGATEGNPSDMPPSIDWKDGQWESGEPDLIIAPKVSFTVPPTDQGEDIYQCIVVPTNLAQDTWIQGFEYKIDNPSIVHHMIGFIDKTGQAAKLDALTPEPGYPCEMGSGVATSLDSMVGGWAPGMPPNIYSEGVGKLIPGNSHFIFQMHYHNETGKTHTDASSVGFYLPKGKIQKKGRIMPIGVFGKRLFIPAGDSNVEHQTNWNIRKPVDILSLMPHMHYIGKDMTFTHLKKDGSEEILLSVPSFDFNWQTVYGLSEPARLERGDKLHVLGHHDNSAENPNNPNDPPIDVRWGESTSEEMLIGWVGYIYPDEELNIDPPPLKLLSDLE